MEFRGEGWTTQDMSERCGQETDGSFTGSEGCDSENAAGYCAKSVADGTFEYTMLTLSEESDCEGNKMACETFIGGKAFCMQCEDMPFIRQIIVNILLINRIICSSCCL